MSAATLADPLLAWRCAGFDSPCYEPRHRDLAAQLAPFIQTHLAGIFADTTSTQAVRIRAGVKALADHGWLDYLDVVRTGDAAARLDVRAIGLVRQALAYCDDLADCAYSIQGLGLAPLALHGSAALREQFLLPSLRGDSLGGFAITEATGGSHAGAMATRAERDGDRYILNGEKCWISHAGVADYFCVFAATQPHLGPLGISCFVVPTGTPGFTQDASVRMLAPRPIGRLIFQDCVVPATCLVGRAGFGFRYAMQVIEMYRISLASAAVGTSLQAMHLAIGRSKTRASGDQMLADHQLTRDKLASMSTQIAAGSLLAAHAAWVHDTGGKGLGRHAATAKYFTTEAAQDIVDQALQLHGAEGLVVGNRLEALYRQVRSGRIYEGTSDIQKLIIAQAELQR